MPLTVWPMSWPQVLRELESSPDVAQASPGALAALRRVQRRGRSVTRTGASLDWRVAASARPTDLRTFESVPREEGEIEGAIDWLGDRFALRLAATAVARPERREVGAARWQLHRRDARQLDALGRIPGTLVGPGLGRQQYPGQQCASVSRAGARPPIYGAVRDAMAVLARAMVHQRLLRLPRGPPDGRRPPAFPRTQGDGQAFRRGGNRLDAHSAVVRRRSQLRLGYVREPGHRRRQSGRERRSRRRARQSDGRLGPALGVSVRQRALGALLPRHRRGRIESQADLSPEAGRHRDLGGIQFREFLASASRMGGYQSGLCGRVDWLCLPRRPVSMSRDTAITNGPSAIRCSMAGRCFRPVSPS